MYSLDINFLNDRPEYRLLKPTKKKGPGIQVADRQFLIAGVAIGVFPLALVGGWWLLTQNNNQTLQAQLDKLTGDASQWASKQSEVNGIKAESDRVHAETQGLASLFNTTIKPVSALLQEVRDRVPTGLQVSKIERKIDVDPLKKPIAAPPPPPPPPPPAGASSAPIAAKPAPVLAPPTAVPWQMFTQRIVLSGTATSFDDVNDFVIRLKQSQLLDSTDIKLVEAQLVKNPLQPVSPKNQGQNASPPRVALPNVVEYEIEAGVSQVPASEVVAELERQGAIGLATRIDTLKQKGVIQP